MGVKLPEDPKALLTEASQTTYGTPGKWFAGRHGAVLTRVGKDAELHVIAHNITNDADAQFIAAVGGTDGLFSRLVDALERLLARKAVLCTGGAGGVCYIDLGNTNCPYCKGTRAVLVTEEV